MLVQNTAHTEECQYVFKINEYFIVFYCEEEKRELPILKYKISTIQTNNRLPTKEDVTHYRITSLNWIDHITTDTDSITSNSNLEISAFITPETLENKNIDIKEYLLQYIQQEFENFAENSDTSITPTTTSEIIALNHNGYDSYSYFIGSSTPNYALTIKFLLDDIGIQLIIRNSSVWHLTKNNVEHSKQALVTIAENFLKNFEIYDSKIQDCNHLKPGMYPIKQTEKEVTDKSNAFW
jgi:hypothetical protein